MIIDYVIPNSKHALIGMIGVMICAQIMCTRSIPNLLLPSTSRHKDLHTYDVRHTSHVPNGYMIATLQFYVVYVLINVRRSFHSMHKLLCLVAIGFGQVEAKIGLMKIFKPPCDCPPMLRFMTRGVLVCTHIQFT